jgi:hypothetical protein
MSKKDEIAALKAKSAAQDAKIAELEAKLAPPKPFVAKPHEPIDWTARMSMPRSALEAMIAAEPRNFMADVVRDNRGPTGPTGMIPRSQQASSGGGPANVPGSGTGWAHETPIGPPPGLRYVDQQLDAQDAKDRAELVKRDAQLKAMEKLAEGKS